VPRGAFVPPGIYDVRLTVDGRTLSQPLKVAMDPRSDATPADLKAQQDFYAAITQALEGLTSAHERIEAVSARLKSLAGELAGRAALQETAKRLAADVDRFRTGPSEDNLDAVAGVLTALATDVEGVDRAPTGPQREVLATYRQRLDAALTHWQALATGPLRDLDRQVREAGLAPVLP
jgi:hypothetical protein